MTRCSSCPRSWAAGLAVGWLGADAGVSGTRMAVDLALAWALVAASLVALDRARWRRSRVLLAAAAFALLAADLQWASSDALVDARLPARGAVGGAPRPGRADVSRGAPLVACRVGRRSPARTRSALGGQLVGALRAARLARPALGRAAADRGRRRRPSAGAPGRCASALACCPARADVCASLRGPARRAQAPLLVGAAPRRSRDRAVVGLGEPRPARSAPTLETIGRARLRCSSRSGSSQGSSGRGCVDRRRPSSSSSCRTRAATSLRERLARVARRPDARARVSARRRPLRRCHGPAARAAAEARIARSRS